MLHNQQAKFKTMYKQKMDVGLVYNKIHIFECRMEMHGMMGVFLLLLLLFLLFLLAVVVIVISNKKGYVGEYIKTLNV